MPVWAPLGSFPWRCRAVARGVAREQQHGDVPNRQCVKGSEEIKQHRNVGFLLLHSGGSCDPANMCTAFGKEPCSRKGLQNAFLFLSHALQTTAVGLTRWPSIWFSAFQTDFISVLGKQPPHSKVSRHNALLGSQFSTCTEVQSLTKQPARTQLPNKGASCRTRGGDTLPFQEETQRREWNLDRITSLTSEPPSPFASG